MGLSSADAAADVDPNRISDPVKQCSNGVTPFYQTVYKWWLRQYGKFNWSCDLRNDSGPLKSVPHHPLVRLHYLKSLLYGEESQSMRAQSVLHCA